MYNCCPVCANAEGWKELLAFNGIPRSGLLNRSGQSEAKRFDIVFEYCPVCGIGRRSPSTGVPPDYSGNKRSTAQQAPEYLPSLAETALRACSAKTPFIVEIGGNDGSFLRMLRDAVCGDFLNIEPSKELSAVSAGNGIRSLCAYFDFATASRVLAQHGSADIVFIRHVVEHVPMPMELLQAAAVLLREGGVLCLETPDFSDLIKKCHAHELWEEHLYYFTADTLRHMVENAGFSPFQYFEKGHRGGNNLIVIATRESSAQLSQKHAPIRREESFFHELAAFKKNWNDLCVALHGAANFWRKPVHAMGASHPQINFLHYSGLAGHIDALIDDDPEKTGLFAPLKHDIPIISSDAFKRVSGGTLLLTAWGCDAWTAKLQQHAQNHSIACLDPYIAVNGS